MRMTNPAFVLPDAMKGIQYLLKAARQGGVPQRTLELVGLRVSQINGCAACVQGHVREARKAGESDERLTAVAVWWEAPYFDAAERAALRLAEAVTRTADRSAAAEAVPDEVWDEAADHYDEKQLAALLVMVGTLNLFNRINVTVRERADAPSWEAA
ncbi:carboxymuconolactone decarboxylase family protein [Pseudonocardia cypriaca]|uniref:AhpD family alkylhydroperoxidase n=1 Tax=Pseudonocardia cypriaca TaxID=882449 RepID=A0A543FWJ2_9PSEU|nr:AhpD family alkylhydroperoxidase [Pseudonocardia cypriaca]